MDSVLAVSLLALLAIVVLVALVLRLLVRVTVIHDHERGLRYRRGRLTGLVGSGTHFTLRATSEIRVLDVRPVFVVVDGQELLTSDGVAVKVSLVARYVVGDAAAAMTRDADFRRAIHLRLQLALRDSVGGRTLDQALGARREIGPEVREACAGALAEIGVELLDVQVRDLMLPGDLKRALAAVVVASKEGEAAMERARTQAAVQRSVAGAGRAVDADPELPQPRLLPQPGSSSGNSGPPGSPAAVSAPASTAEPAPASTTASTAEPAPASTAAPAPAATAASTAADTDTSGGRRSTARRRGST